MSNLHGHTLLHYLELQINSLEASHRKDRVRIFLFPTIIVVATLVIFPLLKDVLSHFTLTVLISSVVLIYLLPRIKLCIPTVVHTFTCYI